MQERHDHEGREKVFELIKDVQVAQLVTCDEVGRMRSRPMVAQQNEFSGDLWFFTPRSSRKVREIERDGNVLLAYSDPSKQHYVNVRGRASVMIDAGKTRELWSEPMRVWFPKGPDDPDIALIRVHVDDADYWDSPSSTFVHAYGYVKAVVTGERPSPGEVAHVEMSDGGARRDHPEKV